MHSAQFMGLINAVRTGDPVVDTLLAFLLPFLVQQVIIHVPINLKKLLKHLFGQKEASVKYFTRNIIHRTTMNASSGLRMALDEDSHNMYLLRAVQLYINNQCQLLRLEDAHLGLTMLDPSDDQNGRLRHPNNHNGTSASTVDKLSMCSFVEKPPENIWLDVGKHDGGTVEIMICDSESSHGGREHDQQNKHPGGQDNFNKEGGEKTSTRSLEIKLRSKKSVGSLHSFLRTALDW